ncbi:unnamed protein product [Pleuronectes platessa]|uniref:Uncharacterized protein n=1 Tax=Pleuronectes platessa TaxID=8262 RepID=A0A9N7VB69_PLEPL|nr:unnamed protein product [Pleuronectes platessa]
MPLAQIAEPWPTMELVQLETEVMSNDMCPLPLSKAPYSPTICSPCAVHGIALCVLHQMVTASQSGIRAIYPCHQPTSQLHTLLPDGSVRESARGSDLIAHRERVSLEAMPGNMVGGIKAEATATRV